MSWELGKCLVFFALGAIFVSLIDINSLPETWTYLAVFGAGGFVGMWMFAVMVLTVVGQCNRESKEAGK